MSNPNENVQAKPAPAAPLSERIKAWRENDKSGYDTAIELLCEAEAELDRLRAEKQALRAALTNRAVTWRNQALVLMGGEDVEHGCRGKGMSDCADELDALLAATPADQER